MPPCADRVATPRHERVDLHGLESRRDRRRVRLHDCRPGRHGRDFGELPDSEGNPAGVQGLTRPQLDRSPLRCLEPLHRHPERVAARWDRRDGEGAVRLGGGRLCGARLFADELHGGARHGETLLVDNHARDDAGRLRGRGRASQQQRRN